MDKKKALEIVATHLAYDSYSLKTINARIRVYHGDTSCPPATREDKLVTLGPFEAI